VNQFNLKLKLLCLGALALFMFMPESTRADILAEKALSVEKLEESGFLLRHSCPSFGWAAAVTGPSFGKRTVNDRNAALADVAILCSAQGLTVFDGKNGRAIGIFTFLQLAGVPVRKGMECFHPFE
jgi:hypothetical protein